MTATLTDVHAYIEDLRATIPEEVHPAGRATINWWLQDMHAAADQYDDATLARLGACILDKIKQEVEWAAESGSD